MLSSDWVTLFYDATLSTVSVRKHVFVFSSLVGSCHMMERAGCWEAIDIRLKWMAGKKREKAV